MASANWYKIDNVSKVFLATLGKRDTRSFRLSCTLKEDVDPELLQQAVLSAIEDRPQVQVRIRRGFFWHYMEDTDLVPVVREEDDRICPLLYVPSKTMLHYQVTYYGNRINLDMSHVLADGTGAMEFLNIIVLDYLRRKYPGELTDITVHSGASEGDLSQDSYRQFFGSKNLSHGPARQTAYHLSGLKLPYDQLQFFEIRLPTSQILPRAKEIKVSLTSYLGALWMLAIRDEMPPRKRHLPVTISLPVNLRNYYPSKTARNSDRGERQEADGCFRDDGVCCSGKSGAAVHQAACGAALHAEVRPEGDHDLLQHGCSEATESARGQDRQLQRVLQHQHHLLHHVRLRG